MVAAVALSVSYLIFNGNSNDDDDDDDDGDKLLLLEMWSMVNGTYLSIDTAHKL